MFTTKLHDRGAEHDEVIIEQDGVAVLRIPIGEWLELSMVKYAQKLAREEFMPLGPAA
jgi:hypothetical protein